MRSMTDRFKLWDLNLWFFTLLIVWGWRGNCYGQRRVLRFDFGSDAGVHRFKVSWITGNRLTTEIYIYRFFQPWKWIWNSEHLAARYGSTQGGETGPEWTCWNSRWLGQHIIC